MDAAQPELHSSSESTSWTPIESEPSKNNRLWNEDDSQIVLVLVGLIGSGKSTFAKALENNLPEFRRCNQDDLGDRRAVEELARESLRQGLSVCIDRTNFDEQQRSYWIRISREFSGSKLWCVIFDTPLHVIATFILPEWGLDSLTSPLWQICTERLQRRTNHPTIRSPEQGIEVLHRFKNMFRPPSGDEGFERIFRVKPEDHTSENYSRDEVQTLLVRIATSSPTRRPAPQREIREYLEPATPNRSEWSGNSRSCHSSRGSTRRGTSFSRGARTGSYPDSGFRVSDSRPDSHNSWRSGLASVQSKHRELGRDSFQNNGRIDMAAEPAPHANSQHALVRTVPSRQAGDGTAENPVAID